MMTTTTPLNPKYRAEYTSLEGNYLLDIWDKDYTGEIIEIRGNVRHNYTERKDTFQPVISSNLDVILEADEDFNFTDLYSENERQLTAKLYRNNQIIFQGYLIPDNTWDDFTSNRWEIKMIAIDGLSMLNSLSFVTDEGDKYKGKIAQFTALRQCLKRIGYELPINISNLLPTYEGFTGTETILKSVLINADRFYQDERQLDLMDCDEVLKSILELYKATIIQMHGEWWIYRTIDVKEEMTFYRYENGEKTGDIVWNTELNVGSQGNNYSIFHCGANQSKRITPSAQAFRVHYKYGTVKSLVENTNLELGTGLACEGWNIEGFGGAVVPQDKNRGVKVISDIDETPDLLWISNSQTIELTENDVIDVIFELITSHRTFSKLAPNILCYSFETDNFIMSGGGWISKAGNESQRIVKNYGTKGQSIKETFNLPRSPETSNLVIKVWIRQINVDFSWSQFYFNRIDVVPNTTNNIKGEFHTAQRTKRISSVTKEDKVVNNGDSLSDIYYGTLYKEDGEPTQLWNRHDEPTAKPILQILVEDILRLSPRPMYYFEGDLYGYYPYLSKIQINNIPGVYQVAKYSFDTVKNTNKNALKEYATEYLIEGVDFTYKPTLDLGEVTKVTILSK